MIARVLQGYTRVYSGLQGYGFQGVIRVYNGLQGITRGWQETDRGIQGFAMDCKGNTRGYFMNHAFSFVIQHPLFNLHTS